MHKSYHNFTFILCGLYTLIALCAKLNLCLHVCFDFARSAKHFREISCSMRMLMFSLSHMTLPSGHMTLPSDIIILLMCKI